MSITKRPAYHTDDGTAYASLELAQRAELHALFTKNGSPIATQTSDQLETVADLILINLEDVVSILCASGRKPRTAKAGRNGKRKVKVEVANV